MCSSEEVLPLKRQWASLKFFRQIGTVFAKQKVDKV